MTAGCPSVFKTAKAVPVFNRSSKLDYSNYRPISLLLNIEKVLEKLMYMRLCTFLNNKLTVWIQITIFYMSYLN